MVSGAKEGILSYHWELILSDLGFLLKHFWQRLSPWGQQCSTLQIHQLSLHNSTGDPRLEPTYHRSSLSVIVNTLTNKSLNPPVACFPVILFDRSCAHLSGCLFCPTFNLTSRKAKRGTNEFCSTLLTKLKIPQKNHLGLVNIEIIVDPVLSSYRFDVNHNKLTRLAFISKAIKLHLSHICLN